MAAKKAAAKTAVVPAKKLGVGPAAPMGRGFE